MLMDKAKLRKPDFLIIGAQKSGTTWLWNMLRQHPGVCLPKKKEIHYFGGSENYHQGRDSYYQNFTGIEQSLITGEASTSYLFDNIPFWYNRTNDLVIDHSLPTIPELIKNELPDVRIIAILRDPVKRAISAYKHYIRSLSMNKQSYNKDISPLFSLKKIASSFPKKRILEYGFYSRYIKVWYRTFPKDQIKIFIFEEDLIKNPEKMVSGVYQFLGLDSDFKPDYLGKVYNKSWGRTRSIVSYYLPNFLQFIIRNKGGKLLDRHDILGQNYIKAQDIEYLVNAYRDEKVKLEKLLNRPISWGVGELGSELGSVGVGVKP